MKKRRYAKHQLYENRATFSERLVELGKLGLDIVSFLLLMMVIVGACILIHVGT